MMKKIDPRYIKIKNLLGIVDNPTHEDLLYEILQFLEDENRLDGEFKKWDVDNKTRCRIKSSIEDDLRELVERGYLEHTRYTLYRVVKHPWQ